MPVLLNEALTMVIILFLSHTPGAIGWEEQGEEDHVHSFCHTLEGIGQALQAGKQATGSSIYSFSNRAAAGRCL
jgi:hypothetical protein